MTADTHSSFQPRPTHSLVLVHGIGNAGAGVMLRNVVASVVSLGKDLGVDAGVDHAVLGESRPRAVLRVGSHRSDVVEASWGHLVPEPTFRRVALWLAVVAPFTVIGLIAAIPRRWHEIRAESLGAALAWLMGAVVVRVILFGVLFPLWFLPLLILAAIPTLIPVARAQTILLRLQSAVSSTIGDSYVFIDDPTAAAAITEIVLDTIRNELATHDRVTIAAHSQGAHLALAALRQLDPAERGRCTLNTWGSGVRKLHQLESVTRDQPIAAIQATAVVCGLPLVAAAIAWADGAWTLLGFGLAALGLLWWWIVKIAPLYRIDPETANEFSPAPAKWVDIWATRDLVPDGGLENPTADSQPVCNTRSALGDHSSYHRNPEVLAELLAAMTDEVDLASLKTVVGDIRPRWYFWRRIAAAAAALSVCVRLVLSDRWQLVGHGLVISTYFAWSRAEFTWRLRRQRQLAPRSAGPFRWWVADSRDPLSYPTLVASMLAGMALATVLGTTPPATIRLDTAPGVSAGFGSPRALLSSIGAYVLTIAVYLVIRRVRSRSQSTG